MGDGGLISSYIIANDFPCLKYVKGISGAFGVASFLKNYVATYKALGFDNDVELYLRCIDRCKILYASRRMSSNSRDFFLDLDGLDKEQRAKIRGFFTNNKYSRENPPTLDEATAWVRGVLSETVAYDGCQSYYKTYNPELDCCKLCPLSHRNCNKGLIRERTLLREVVSNPDSMDCFLSKGITKEMFRGICNLAGDADPSRDRPVLFSHSRFFWVLFSENPEFLDELRRTDSHEMRVDRISNLSVAKIPELLRGNCGGRFPNALSQTISAMVLDFFGKNESKPQDPPALADSFVAGYGADCESLRLMSKMGVLYTAGSPFSRETNRETLAASDSAKPISEKRLSTSTTTCWRLATSEEVEDLSIRMVEDADGSNVPGGELMTISGKDPSPAPEVDAFEKKFPLAPGSTDAVSGKENPGADPLAYERRPFKNSMVCVPFVPDTELVEHCINLDTADPRTLTTLMNALVGGLRPCRAKTPSVLSIELISLDHDRYAFLMFVPTLGTYFYTGLKNGDVRRLLEQAFRYEPLAKYCYMPFMLTSQLRLSGIVTIKNLRSLYTLSSVLYQSHSMPMEECLFLLGCVSYRKSDGIYPYESTALRFMHCYHRTYKAAMLEIKTKGLAGVLQSAAKYDSVLSYSFLHKTENAYGGLFVMRKAGDYLFPAQTDADLTDSSAWCFSVDPERCDAPFVIRELLFGLFDERVFRKTGATIISLGNFFVSISVPKDREIILRDRVNLMLEGIAHREGYRYFDYSRTRLSKNQEI